MAKTLRVRERSGWDTKPAADIPENRLSAEEVDDNFLAMEDQAGFPWVTKDAAYTASSGDQLIVEAGVTITMPSSPSAGDWVEFACGGDWATTNSTVDGNGENIMGSAEDLTLDQNAGFGLVYKAATQGWAIY